MTTRSRVNFSGAGAPRLRGRVPVGRHAERFLGSGRNPPHHSRQSMNNELPARGPRAPVVRTRADARPPRRQMPRLWLALLGPSLILTQGATAEFAARQIRDNPDPTHATVRVRPRERSQSPVTEFITGKFAEHLGWNIYNGMDAQILRNPTFADYPVWTGSMTPDGVTRFHVEDSRINEELRRQAARFGWAESELDSLLQGRPEAFACFWSRAGSHDDVLPSPDTGPHGGRAQRVEVNVAG